MLVSRPFVSRPCVTQVPPRRVSSSQHWTIVENVLRTHVRLNIKLFQDALRLNQRNTELRVERAGLYAHGSWAAPTVSGCAV
jgi:hypothetical protein